MNIQALPLKLALRRAKRLTAGTLNRKRPLDFVPQQPRTLALGKLATRTGFLSEGGTHPSATEFERLMGTNDLVDEFFLERGLLAARPVCRVSIRAPGGSERGCATGFMISPRLLLTNHHVFSSKEEAAPSAVEFNYRLDIAGNPEPSYLFQLRPDKFFFTDETLDFTVVAVEGTVARGDTPLSTFGYLRLIADSGKALLKEWMNIIQHPGGARRQFALRDNQCIADTDPDVIWYMSDTSQGSSGAPVLNDSFQVVALHHAGVPRRNAAGLYVLKNGKTVSELKDIDDSEVDWVANAGIRVSRICRRLADSPEQNGYLAEWQQAMQGGDVLADAFANPSSVQPSTPIEMNPLPSSAAGTTRIQLGTLFLELNSGVLASQVQTVAARGSNGSSAVATEAAKEPIIAPNLETRKGFDAKFLGVATPLPEVTKKTMIAPLKVGGTELKYEHFSVVTHKVRRMAIFTASNVDGRPASKKPEAGRDYTRKGLTGLADGDTEKWVIDPRLADAYQLPDKFYTNDNGAFDKGHIVRREDVCWGKNYDEVQRANGDTFHVANCSPQRGNFNQSGKHGIWGNLENFIGSQADKEIYCLFAGPVLADGDGVFSGADLSGPVKVKIPKRFWKVVCAVKDGKLQIFPFVLEQTLSGLPLEFQVNAEWKHSLVSLAKLEQTIKLVKFQKLYHDADQGK